MNREDENKGEHTKYAITNLYRHIYRSKRYGVTGWHGAIRASNITTTTAWYGWPERDYSYTYTSSALVNSQLSYKGLIQ